jgi:hypothetical protein
MDKHHLGVSSSMIGQRRPAVAVSGIHPEQAEKDDVAEAIDQVLDEVRAARLDLRVTRFCLQQAEALRRIDRAEASIVDLAQREAIKGPTASGRF